MWAFGVGCWYGCRGLEVRVWELEVLLCTDASVQAIISAEVKEDILVVGSLVKSSEVVGSMYWISLDVSPMV